MPVRALRTAALVVFCLMGGASAVMAAEHLQDQERKQLLVAQLDIQIEVAGLRLDHLRKHRELAEGLFAEGMSSSSKRDLARDQHFAEEITVKLLQLDLEEVRVTGRNPRHDLAAPLVDGRDLVLRRLSHQRDRELRELVRSSNELERQGLLAEAGLVMAEELAEVEQRVEALHRGIGLLDERLTIRTRFISGDLVAAQVDLLDRLAAAREAVAVQRLALAALGQQLEYARKQQGAGVQSGKVYRLELELQLAEGELRLRELELTLLEQHGAGH